MELIDRDDHQKLYLQVYNIIRKKIETNEWQVGSQIPTEGDLCKLFNVSRATVRTAVLDLTRQGYLKRQQGKGTFIRKNSFSEGFLMNVNLKELLIEYDEEPKPEVLVRTVMMPVDGLDIKLDLTPDKHIIYIKKLWKVHNEPVLLQEIYVPYHVCPLLLEDEIGQYALFDLFEKNYGIKVTRVKNYFDIIHMDDTQNGIAESMGSPAMRLTQEYYSGDTIVAYSVSKKRPNRFQMFFELERNAS